MGIICKDNKQRKNEAEISGSHINKVDTILYEVCKSICKIYITYSNNNLVGSGFLIKLYIEDEPLYCLMTNEHIISREIIDSKESIEICYNNEKKNTKIILNKNERYIEEYTNIGLDITIVQILVSIDNIKEKFFLLPNLDYINDYNKLKDENIYIPQYPKGGNISFSKGKIKEIFKYEFSYDASTSTGSSGSPILLDKTRGVIGIHKQGDKNKIQNFGDFIYPVLIYLKTTSKAKLNNNYLFESINNKENKELSSKNQILSKENINNQKNYNFENDNYKEKGILTYENGNIKYRGEFKNGKPEGNGKIFFENGNYYVGEFLNGKRNGKGIEYYKNGKVKYEGDIVNDKYEGKGKYIFEDDEYYIGQFSNDKKHGKGKEYYKNGKLKYEGDFVNGKFEGTGKYIDENGNCYLGHWSEGKRHGKGKAYDRNGKIKYEGDFDNDKYEGEGKYIFENGNYYIGQFLKGKRHGKGKEYYKNGTIKYEGVYINGKAEGYGKYIFENGNYYLGEWSNGLKHGKGKICYKNGKIKCEGNFVNDKYQE